MRVGIIAIAISDSKYIDRVNQLIHENNEMVIGRMGIPIKEKDLRLISLIVEGDTDRIGCMAGSVGQLEGVEIRSLLLKSLGE